jgi:hypothetical protein
VTRRATTKDFLQVSSLTPKWFVLLNLEFLTA